MSLEGWGKMKGREEGSDEERKEEEQWVQRALCYWKMGEPHFLFVESQIITSLI